MSIDRLCQILLEQLRLKYITADEAIEQLKEYYVNVQHQKDDLKLLKSMEKV